MPPSAFAIAKMRRAMRALLSALASLRKLTGERSRLIFRAAISASIESMAAGNHHTNPDGITSRPQQSGISIGGITSTYGFAVLTQLARQTTVADLCNM